MRVDPRIAGLRRRIRQWLPASADPASGAGDDLEALEADFTVLEGELQALFPEQGTEAGFSAPHREKTVLRLVLESMIEGVIVADMGGQMLVFNRAAKTLLGRGPGSAGPEGWSEEFGVFHTDGKTPFPSEELPLSRALRGESVDAVELLIRTSERPADCHVMASARPLHDHAGNQLGGVVVFHDVTAFKEAEQELRQAREMAEANDRAKSEFLANMSHEIRTPLTAVLGFSDLLLDSRLSDSDRLNYIQAIRRNGEHLLALISDVLDVSKVNANQLQVEAIDCPLPQILEEVASVMQVRAVDKGLAFNLSYETPVPARIRSDPTRLRQILYNLLSNAVKFTREGAIDVLARCVDAHRPTARVEVDVRDTGIGLSEAEIAELFQPFRQANASTTREYGGTGLGLTICRSLAEALGGEIRIHSAPQAGSTFTLVLHQDLGTGTEMVDRPGVIVDDRSDDARSATRMRQLTGRILLAEDGPDNQVLLSTILRRQGLEVEIEANGQAAVKRALGAWEQGSPFDLVLMDMQMPKLDGYGATARLRASGYTWPIVALTAHAMEGERERCMAAGCDDFLTKPILRHELLTAVASHLHPGSDEPIARREPEHARQEAAGPGAMPEASDAPIHSVYASDPDMTELVAGFVERLPGQLRDIEAALESGDLSALVRLAHQIKGAAGGYGFMPLSHAAAALEEEARRASHGRELGEAVKRFTGLCGRIRSD